MRRRACTPITHNVVFKHRVCRHACCRVKDARSRKRRVALANELWREADAGPTPPCRLACQCARAHVRRAIPVRQGAHLVDHLIFGGHDTLRFVTVTSGHSSPVSLRLCIAATHLLRNWSRTQHMNTLGQPQPTGPKGSHATHSVAATHVTGAVAGGIATANKKHRCNDRSKKTVGGVRFLQKAPLTRWTHSPGFSALRCLAPPGATCRLLAVGEGPCSRLLVRRHRGPTRVWREHTMLLPVGPGRTICHTCRLTSAPARVLERGPSRAIAATGAVGPQGRPVRGGGCRNARAGARSGRARLISVAHAVGRGTRPLSAR